jgi:integrase
LNHYFPSLQEMPIDGVTRRDVAVAVAEIARQHGPVSASRARTALSRLLYVALKEGIASGESNPATFTNDPATEKPRERVLKPAEMRAIWHSLPDTDFGKIIKLLFYSACRRQEIGSLEWSEINFDKALLTIPGEKTKNHRTHRLPLVPEAIEILQSVPRRDSNPYVFGTHIAARTHRGDEAHAVARPGAEHDRGLSLLAPSAAGMMIRAHMRRVAEVDVGAFPRASALIFGYSCLSHCCTSASSRSNARCSCL